MNKKTMQQIVQEEEALARKKKAALAAAASVAATTLGSGIAPVVSTGKRYADLAGKAASPAPGPAGAWTTVGAGGKTKTPATPTIAPAAVKAPSVIPSASAPVRPKAVTTVTAASKTSLAAAQLNAYEEFKKWAIAELRPDLHKDIQGLSLPPPLLACKIKNAQKLTIPFSHPNSRRLRPKPPQLPLRHRPHHRSRTHVLAHSG